MKQFFKMLFASMLGFVLAGVILLFITIGIITSAVSKFGPDEEVDVKANSVLRLDLKGRLSERTSENPFASYNFANFQDNRHAGLVDIIRSIQKAKDDTNISGIYMEFDPGFYAGYASMEEIRNAIMDFKKSGKFVYAYSELFTDKNYYLATAADKVYMNPSGELIFNGMAMNITFFKGMFDKLGIEMQVFKAGKFKGAVEPFVLTELSPENRHQIDVYLGSLYNTYISGIAASRKLDTVTLYNIAENMLVRSANDAVAQKMIDGLKHHDQVMDELRTKLGIEGDGKINFIEPFKYRDVKAETKEDKDTDKQGRIAIIYANGDIVDGEGDMETVGSHSLREAIIKARKNDRIKAVVLRINSPGGSALASEVIHRELELLRGAKPLVVSMGDVAASGGYYIAMAADTIVAQPNTITGSIGVFGLLPNAQKLLNDKLGITIDGVKKGKYSDLGRGDRALTADEGAIIQNYVDTIYMQFLQRVATSRRMTVEQVNEIAQGRVWTAADAKEIGLIDVMGGIQTALDIAAQKAGLTNYRISELPVEKNPFEQFFGGMTTDTKTKMLQEELGENYVYYMQMRRVLQRQGVLTRMPFEITVE